GGVVLLSEKESPQVEVRPLVLGVRRDELVEVFLLLNRVVVRSRLGREDEEPLAVRGLVRQADGLLQVIEELRAGGRGVREGELGPGETRVERDRLLEMRDGVGQEQLLEHVPA